MYKRQVKTFIQFDWKRSAPGGDQRQPIAEQIPAAGPNDLALAVELIPPFQIRRNKDIRWSALLDLLRQSRRTGKGRDDFYVLLFFVQRSEVLYGVGGAGGGVNNQGFRRSDRFS